MAQATAARAAALLAGALTVQLAGVGPAPAMAQSRLAAVELSSSELHAFRASDGTLYEISVALPFGYVPDGGDRYPVVYLTDASWHFAMAAQIIRGRQMEDGLPPLILVGVDRPSGSVLEDLAERQWDLSPTRDQRREAQLSELYGEPVRTGGAEAFLAALTGEIVPWIEERYPVSGTRVLAGHSLGGLFAIQALFSTTGVFTGYLSLSPALSWDDGMMFGRERAYADMHADLRARLFLGAGAEEDPEIVPDMRRLADVLEARQYPGLEIASRVFEGEAHMSVVPVALSHGLTFLFGDR